MVFIWCWITFPNSFNKEENLKSLSSDLTFHVNEASKENEGLEIKNDILYFYELFFRIAILYIYYTCPPNDFRYCSIIKISKVVFREKGSNDVSAFDIMIEKELKRLNNEFQQDYKKFMQLYDIYYSNKFTENIKYGIYHYLQTEGISYQNRDLPHYIERKMKDTSGSILDYFYYTEKDY